MTDVAGAADAGWAELSVFLDALAARRPVPGGGAAAALSGAMAAALAAMVVRYAQGSKALAQHEAALSAALSRLERARALCLALGEADMAAYGVLNAAMKIDKTDAGRAAAMRAAAAEAVVPPRAVMAAGVDLLRLVAEVVPITSRMLASDLVCAAAMARAAVVAGAANVRANLPLLDASTTAMLEAECAQSDSEASRREAEIAAAVAART